MTGMVGPVVEGVTCTMSDWEEMNVDGDTDDLCIDGKMSNKIIMHGMNCPEMTKTRAMWRGPG